MRIWRWHKAGIWGQYTGMKERTVGYPELIRIIAHHFGYTGGLHWRGLWTSCAGRSEHQITAADPRTGWVL
jgi:hypothetical protein